MMIATIDTVNTELTEAEARVLTDRIKRTADELWRLLLEAHERQAWAALGYASWREYAKNEFEMGQSHVYRLLDQGRVIRAIEHAAGGSPMGELVNERLARDLKPQIEAVTEAIEAGIAAGGEPIETVQDVIAKTKITTYLDSRKRVDRDSRYIESLALNLAAFVEVEECHPIDAERVDQDRILEWAASLRQSARRIEQLAFRLERGAQGR